MTRIVEVCGTYPRVYYLGNELEVPLQMLPNMTVFLRPNVIGYWPAGNRWDSHCVGELSPYSDYVQPQLLLPFRRGLELFLQALAEIPDSTRVFGPNIEQLVRRLLHDQAH